MCAFGLMGRASADESPASAINVPNLSGFTIDQLREVLSTRRNKTAYASPESSTLKSVSDALLIGEIINREKTIYGFDRRVEYHEIQDPRRLVAADSVAAVVDPDHFAESDDRFALIGRSLEAQFNVCSGEAFLTERVVAMCTAFVVGDDLIATAGHCVDAFKTKRIVFGYRVQKAGTGESSIPVEIPKSDVYEMQSLVAWKVEPDGRDFALVKVSRPISNHPRLELDTVKPAALEDPVYVLGYPLGLPLKMADHANVRSVSTAKGYFVSNLDTFGGNSGSPVFNSITNKVLGILVRGDADFKSNGSCNKAMVCPDTGCAGESATLVSAFSDSLPKLAKANTSQPIVKTFDSDWKLSGVRKSFSEIYVVQSDLPPPGYEVGSYTYSLTGDRQCNAWSTCVAGRQGNQVVFSFSLQGHDEWPGLGQGKSQGHLIVTYIPSSRHDPVTNAGTPTFTLTSYEQTLQGGQFRSRQIPGCGCGIGPDAFAKTMAVSPNAIRARPGQPISVSYDASLICQKQTIRDMAGRVHGPVSDVGSLVLGHADWDKNVGQELPLEWGIITYPGYSSIGDHELRIDVKVECADRPGNNFCPDSGFRVCEAQATIPVVVAEE